MPEWETISTEMPYVYRLAVPGGWLYRVYDSRSTTSLVFVPDPVYQDDTTYDRGYEAGSEDMRQGCLTIAMGAGAAMFSEAEAQAVDAIRSDIIAAIKAAGR